MNDDELKAKLELAFEAGRQTGAAEKAPPLLYFSNGSTRLDKDPGGEAYQDELRPLIFRLQGEGVRGRRMLDSHPEVIALKEKHGR